MNNIGLSKGHLENVANKLNKLLSDYQIHYQNLRAMHWLVKGPNFFQLHEAFEKMYDDAAEKIDEIAKQLGLNEAEFQQDQKNPDFVQQIRQDYEEGIRLGLRGVPTVFINGKKMRQRDVETLESAINTELEKAKETGN